MKTMKFFFRSFKFHLSGIIFGLGMMVVFSCNTQDNIQPSLKSQIPGNPTADLASSARQLNLSGEAVNLEGFTLFDIYAVKEKFAIVSNDWMRAECKATLIHVEGQDYILNTKEYFGDFMFRELNYNIKMTPSGVVTCSWPVPYEVNEDGVIFHNVIEQMEYHTGYELSGPGVSSGTAIYKGSFDGNRFYVVTNLQARQVKPGSMEPYNVMVDGPIRVNFGIELFVTPPIN